MIFSVNIAVTLIAALLYTSNTFAGSETNLCSQLYVYAVSEQVKSSNPSRSPTEKEQLLIDKSKIELLEYTDYAMGVSIVDADNDGKEDLLAWSIQGSGRFVYAELFDIPLSQDGEAKVPIPKASLDLGVLQEPRFVRFKGVNYLISTDTGDRDGLSISRVAKLANGQYEQQTLCHMQSTLRVKTSCKHPACRRLKEIIENKNENGSFVNIEWPHKYYFPAGLAVYFPEEGSVGDFDNTQNPTSIWRIGREEYIYQHIYWAWLGQGKEMPEVDSKLRPESENIANRHVLPGQQHDRLRRTLEQQSEILSRKLHRPISLPNKGEFFLFNANKNKTYWGWDLGEFPDGNEIYVMYTNAGKSDYIGMVQIERSHVLVP